LVFLPAKEVLSLQPVILKSCEQDKSFGFGDTYLDLDLARALRNSPQRGRKYMEFAQSRKDLKKRAWAVVWSMMRHRIVGNLKRETRNFPLV